MDIDAIYQQFGVELTQQGNRWKASCPFHAETAPSFVVYPDGSYHCFGCQAHGTLKKFLTLMGEDPDTRILVSAADVKEQDFDLMQRKREMEDLLLYQLKKESYAKKDSAWRAFDNLWIKIFYTNKQANARLIDVLLQVKRGQEKLLRGLRE